MAIMLLVSLLVSYPLFMLFVYLVARVIFTPLDKIEEDERRERVEMLMKARRVRRPAKAHPGILQTA